MSEEVLTGGCLCGGVRFEIDQPLVSAGYCHCTHCQRRSGAAASAQARVAPGSVHVIQGEELLRAYQPFGGFEKVFCSHCGSSLWSTNPADQEIYSVRLGAFDGDPGIRPQYRQFVGSAAPWEPIPEDGLQQYEESGQKQWHSR